MGIIPQIGDILVVRSPGLYPALIRLGARLAHEPAVDHVAIVHHIDPAGDVWVVEAEPHGVVMTRAGSWLTDPKTLTNARQVPKSGGQRQAVAAVAESFVKTPYDWPAIWQDVLNVLSPRDPELSDWIVGEMPTHVVCSSLASKVYREVGLATPRRPARYTTPGDWARFIIANNWGEE